MSHVMLIAITVDEVGDADDTDLVEGLIARLEEFYPTADPVSPSRITAAVLSPAVAWHINSALAVGLEDGLDAPTGTIVGDALDVVDALDLGEHGGPR